MRELQERDLFERVGSRETEAIEVRQTLDDFVESYHSRNGLSRDRLTPEAAAAFDFSAWLQGALRHTWLKGVSTLVA